MKNKYIPVEEARNKKDEGIPEFQTHYVAFSRSNRGEWFAGVSSTDKKTVMDNLRSYHSGDEIKIISLELPY